MVEDRASDENQRLEALNARIDEQETTIRDLRDRVESAGDQAARSETRATSDRGRIDRLEERADVDAALIAELRAEGLVTREHSENLTAALTTSRRIGAAIGIVMARDGVDEPEAFELIKRASQDTNRKVRMLADDILLTGDIGVLHSR